MGTHEPAQVPPTDASSTRPVVGQPPGFQLRLVLMQLWVVLAVAVIPLLFLSALGAAFSDPCDPSEACGPDKGTWILFCMAAAAVALGSCAIVIGAWRRWRKRQVFHPPPGWPQPPAGWVSEPGWVPPVDWPPAPPDWTYWQR